MYRPTDYPLVNPQALVRIYGFLPPLETFRPRSVNMDWRGPTVTLRVDLSSFPAVTPQEWEGSEVDTVQCHLQFLAVEALSLAEWEPPIASASFRVQPLERDRRIRVRVTGAGVALDFTSSETVLVGHVSAFKISADGTDGNRHFFLGKLDSMHHEAVPGTEEKTFHGRL